MKPVCIDLYCGLGGWSEGFLAEGYECHGYDIEAHDYGTGGYPGTLHIRDIRSIHGSEFKHATCIVGSSPCQEFSYRAMPWSRAKALPPPYLGIELFNHQFRIQREASEATGRHIPMVVENVRGAQKWVGAARWHYGSFYLWGDVPALMPTTVQLKAPGKNWNEWKDWDGREENKPASVRPWGDDGIKTGHPERNGHVSTAHLTNRAEHAKGLSIGGGTHHLRDKDDPAKHWSGSVGRKMASAMIAKIPLPLSLHIAQTFKPAGVCVLPPSPFV